jgi:hypothetical protein
MLRIRIAAKDAYKRIIPRENLISTGVTKAQVDEAFALLERGIREAEKEIYLEVHQELSEFFAKEINRLQECLSVVPMIADWYEDAALQHREDEQLRKIWTEKVKLLQDIQTKLDIFYREELEIDLQNQL